VKRIYLTLLTTVLCLLLGTTVVAAADNKSVTASPASSSYLLVDGVSLSFEAYEIKGNNYFKLRDIAYVLSHTSKKFDVKFDSKNNAINLVSGKKYATAATKLEDSYGWYSKKATASNTKVYLDGKLANVTSYSIDNTTYFKLRDLGSLLDFYVGWDEKENLLVIESGLRYGQSINGYAYKRDVPVMDTQIMDFWNWAEVSSVQQFSYKGDGLAYAFTNEKDKKLIIQTPKKELKVDLLYPILGDVIADETGNFYVIWGRESTSNTKETVFITKYSPEGKLIKTTGFVGASPMKADGNTKIPFNAGKAESAIHDGVLMVNYARTMYNGHQSNNVVGVNIADMSAYPFETRFWDKSTPNIPYVSHSFNQSVIYSEKAQGFVFANHGDAYSRAFVIDRMTKVADEKTGKPLYTLNLPSLDVFNFYLQANANYDMYVVNKTFAQLGGLVETSKGVALVGASAKSISEAAKKEKQNLFVQIFDPLAEEVSKSMFVGGSTRSGATSFDINDSQNSPLTKVTDYGVRWLTNNTEVDVTAPQVVVADDRIVILWSETKNYKPQAYYMVLSASGEILTPKTSLGIWQLNSYEMPIYHDGAIQWAYAANRSVRVVSIKI